MKTILLADDEAHLRELVRTTLEDPEYRILEAATGQEALQMSRAEPVDLVLLDWMMPEMSGIEVAEALRGEEPSLPIIMLTAMGRRADLDRGRSAGVFGYLVKPFSPLELLELIDRALGQQLSD